MCGLQVRTCKHCHVVNVYKFVCLVVEDGL